MHFTIVGAGALGTIIGAHLLAAGHEVSMVARGLRAKNIREHGLRVRGLIDLNLPCQVVEDTSELGDTDVLMLAVKTYHMEGALAGLKHVKPGGVVSVANGVMKNEQLAELYGAARVMGCMADTSGELHADGSVEFTRNVCMKIGAYQQPTTAPVAAAADAINAAGVVTVAVEDIGTVEWSKFTGWAAMFGLAVLARRPTGQYLSNPELARIVVLQVKEACAVAAKMGVTLSDDAPLPVASIMAESVDAGVERVLKAGQFFSENAPTHRMSSLQDMDAGRHLEVHGTLGYLVTKAAEHDIPAPVLGLSYSLVAGIDAMQGMESMQ